MFENRRPTQYDFIQRHEERSEEFYCSHPEMEGRFVIHKPNFGRDMQIERVKAALLVVPNPTESADQFAEWAAVWEVAFSEKPKGVNIDDIVDNRCLRAVYGEVVSFWKCFRSQDAT